jgi:hypothetical protein
MDRSTSIEQARANIKARVTAKARELEETLKQVRSDTGQRESTLSVAAHNWPDWSNWSDWTKST